MIINHNYCLSDFLYFIVIKIIALSQKHKSRDLVGLSQLSQSKQRKLLEKKNELAVLHFYLS